MFTKLRSSIDAVSRNQTNELLATENESALLPGEALLQIADYSEHAGRAMDVSAAIKNAVGEMQPTFVGQISQQAIASESLTINDAVGAQENAA